ncbi:hypothetical protein Tco_0311458 [Tanacetum coccineum]
MVNRLHCTKYIGHGELGSGTVDDNEKKQDFITAIEKKLQIRRIYRSLESLDNSKMEMEMEFPSVKASANSDVMYFFTSAQDGDPSQDDVRLCLGDDLKKAQDHSQARGELP